MKSRVSATLQEKQGRYYRHFETKVRSMPDLQRGQLVYVKRPPLTTASHERTKSQAYRKLMSRTQDPYCVMHVSSHAITIDEKVIPNAISSDRSTPVQNSIQQINDHNGDHISPSVNNAPSPTSSLDHLQRRLPINSEHVVYRRVAHKQTASGTRYQVQMYGYKLIDNTLEPFEHIPNHLIMKNWENRQARSNL